MKQKDLKIDFRYLTGNIACLSVDSISGESVHNDINNEEAIIIFNSLVGEKADCQTVKSLLKENQELKEKYLNAVADYETTMAEKEQLKRQVEDLFSENRNLRKKLEKCMTFEDYKDTLHKKIKLETQQKEFIKYMNNIIKDLEIEDVDDEEMKGYLIQRIDTFREILQKYKSIIGYDK